MSAQSDFFNPSISVGNVVSDLETSVKFYTKIVGMVKTGGFHIEEGFAKKSGLSDGIPFDVVILKLIDDPKSTEWKLVSFNKKANHPKQDFIQDDIGIQYVTIYIDKLQPIIDRIKAAKIPFLGDTPIKLDANRHFVLIQDPDGTFVELIGPL
jgi:catechol 2,3-dioxygenase-like lactoylglutathione lyase family enzyme